MAWQHTDADMIQYDRRV